MIRLDATTRKLQIILGGAVTTNQLPVTVCYSDKSTAGYTGGTQLSNTNSGTAVDILNAPAAGAVRDLDYLSVRNSDTVAATATIRYNDNATLYTIVSVVLQPSDVLAYTHASGWQVTNSSGSVKIVPSATTVDVTDDTTTNATVYPLWVTANSGSLPVKLSSTRLMYNPSTGVMGFGVTPFAWDPTTVKAVDFGPTGGLYGAVAGGLALSDNAYFDGANFKYKTTGAVSFFVMVGGQFAISTAASGSAGGNVTFSAKFTVDNKGNIYGIAGTTGMTDGFFYITSAAGAPTGVPTAVTGRLPAYYDSTNNNFYIYNGGWKKVTLA